MRRGTIVGPFDQDIPHLILDGSIVSFAQTAKHHHEIVGNVFDNHIVIFIEQNFHAKMLPNCAVRR